MRKLIFILLILLLTSCGKSSLNSDCTLPEKPDFQGTIESIFPGKKPLEGDLFVAYQVNGAPRKMYVQVTEDTSIEDATNTAIDITTLAAGDTILVCREGAILNSYPASMTARSIMVQR